MYFDRVAQIPGPGRLATEFCAAVRNVYEPLAWN